MAQQVYLAMASWQGSSEHLQPTIAHHLPSGRARPWDRRWADHAYEGNCGTRATRTALDCGSWPHSETWGPQAKTMAWLGARYLLKEGQAAVRLDFAMLNE